MANAARYFQLRDFVGIEPKYLAGPDGRTPIDNPRAGELQPMQPSVIHLAVPTMIDGELLGVHRPVTIEPIPGTRIVKLEGDVTDPRTGEKFPAALVADAVAQIDLFEEIEAPSKRDLDKARKDTEAARDHRPESGNPDLSEED